MSEKQLDAVALGSCYLDTYLNHFPFDRNDTAREEFIGKGYELVPGGSAPNFCRLGTILGMRTAFIGMVGDDPNGKLLSQLFAEHGVRPSLIAQPELQTNIGLNITNDQQEHLMFVAGTANAALNPEAILPSLQELLPQSRLLYLGGCLKLTSFMDAFPDIVQMAKHYGTGIAVDHGRVPKDVRPEMCDAVKKLVLAATYYFPSKEEFCTLWDVGSIGAGLRKLHTAAPQLVTIVKDGANGASYWRDNAVCTIPAVKVEKVRNLTGAGDSFNTGVLSALQKHKTLDKAIAYGCAVAAATITTQPLPELS